MISLIRRLTKGDSSLLRNFSFVGEKFHHGTEDQLLSSIVDKFTSDRTDPLLCLLLGFFCVFSAFVCCCVGHDNPISMDGTLPRQTMLKVSMVFMVLHFIFVSVADRVAQQKGKNTALYIFVRYSLSAPSTGLLFGAFCSGVGVPASRACPALCCIQVGYYSMHWCHYFTRSFHEWWLQLGTNTVFMLFFMAIVLLDGKPMSVIFVTGRNMTQYKLVNLFVIAIFACTSIFVLFQISIVLKQSPGKGRYDSRSQMITLGSVILYASLCLLWIYQPNSALNSHSLLYFLSFIWIFWFVSRDLLLSDIFYDTPPPNPSWSLLVLAAGAINTYFGWIDPVIVVTAVCLFFGLVGFVYFFVVLFALRSYLIQRPRTPLAFCYCDRSM